MGIAMLTFAEIPVAAPSPSPVVRVQYVVGEKSADRVEEILIDLLERMMRTPDLAAVLHQLAQLASRGNVEPAFISVQLLPPRPEHDAGVLFR
ncbi:hypothetical protein [Massilia sp. DWR3-1-1]|uniref:hypothetical protein n=1 Tax=Massilia sp. DWR3-1-1 TaxID=2804559 RepID=UPI003CEF5D8F